MLMAGNAAAAGPGGYPNKPVKIVVPFAPAGPTDVMARLIAQKLSENLKQQFYVENHAGAGGNIGMSIVAKAAPDGYTILVASSSYVVNPSLYAKNPYDPYKDFAPVTRAAASPNVLVVHESIPAKTVKELVELLQKNPGKYTIANPGGWVAYSDSLWGFTASDDPAGYNLYEIEGAWGAWRCTMVSRGWREDGFRETGRQALFT